MRLSNCCLVAIASLAPLLPSQTATYIHFGNGCVGVNGTSCISSNLDQPLAGHVGNIFETAVLVNTGSTSRQIGAIELITRTRSGNPTDIRVKLAERTATGQPGKLLAIGTMRVGGTTGRYRVTFPSAVGVDPNTDFFIVLSTISRLVAPIMTSGTLQTHFFFSALNWRGPVKKLAWNYNIICTNSTAPRLANVGLPKLGSTFQVTLSSVRASARVMLALGVSRTSLSLGSAGAPGCNFFTDPLLILRQRAGSSGTAAVPLAIPNTRSLIGVQFVNQFAVDDPAANALQLVFSNAGQGTIGT